MDAKKEQAAGALGPKILVNCEWHCTCIATLVEYSLS